MSDRLHPETLRTLRDLVKLHGAAALIAAIKQIGRESVRVVGSGDG